MTGKWVYKVAVPPRHSLQEYRDFPGLNTVIDAVEKEAAEIRKRLRGRKIWMLNSTEFGGGVAEMLPTLIHHFKQLRIPVEWLVLSPTEEKFFHLTKRIHNLLHGRPQGAPGFSAEERAVYESVSRRAGGGLRPFVGKRDLLIVHDPQPLGGGFFFARDNPRARLLWRCHIGTEFQNAHSGLAWKFLRPFLKPYRELYFTHPDYIAAGLRRKSRILYPAIDPLSPKNIWLSTSELVVILQKAGLHPPRLAGFREPIRRLTADGKTVLIKNFDPIDTPIVLQISRWDHLKGFVPLMKGFLAMKRKVKVSQFRGLHGISERILKDCKLVLAGPAFGKIADDPEPAIVLKEILDFYRTLPKKLRDEIYILLLPMMDNRENALICNALQRSADVIVQNSIREGFGLTVTEALWKEIPLLTTAVGGIRLQIENGVTGITVKNPLNALELGKKLLYLLTHYHDSQAFARRGWLKALEEFVTPVQLRHYLAIFGRHL